MPLVGEEGTLYFVPKTDTETSDLYDEYMWINNSWELLGEKQITVDLTDYVKNTDYPTSSTGGVVKNVTTYGASINNAGTIFALTRTYSEYQSSPVNYIISKGTLENVLAEKIGNIESILEELDIGGGIE